MKKAKKGVKKKVPHVVLWIGLVAVLAAVIIYVAQLDNISENEDNESTTLIFQNTNVCSELKNNFDEASGTSLEDSGFCQYPDGTEIREPLWVGGTITNIETTYNAGRYEHRIEFQGNDKTRSILMYGVSSQTLYQKGKFYKFDLRGECFYRDSDSLRGSFSGDLGLLNC